MATSNYTSADKLYDILDLLLKAGQNDSAAEILRIAYNIDKKEPLTTVYKHLMKIINLTSSLKNISKSLGGRSADMYVSNLDDIQEALLSINLHHSTSNPSLTHFSRKLSNGSAMMGLKGLANYIADHNIEKELSTDELESIQCEITELIATVSTSNINDNLKKAIHSNLNNILQLIQEYSYFGSSAISEAMQKTIGQTAFQLSNIEKSEDSTGVVIKLWDTLRNFNTLISFNSNMQQAILIATATLPQLLTGISPQ